MDAINKKIIDIRSFIIFVLVTVILWAIVSKVFGLGFLVACMITGGAILINGLIIALMND